MGLAISEIQLVLVLCKWVG